MVVLTTGLILLTWLSVSTVLVGVGSLVSGSYTQARSLNELFWVGLASCAAIIDITHFIFPVSQFVAIFVIFLGLTGLASNRSRLTAILQKIGSGRLTGQGICFGIVAVCVALRSAGQCEHFDTGLYGASAVRWAQLYPAVPGLANLHGRLGFNSSVFLCHALLDQWVWRGHSQHLFSGLLVVALLGSILPALARLIHPAPATAGDWFLGILIVPCATCALNAEIVGVNTDLPSTIVCLFAFSTLIRGLEAAEKLDRVNAGSRFFVAAVLFSLCVTFKAATVVIAALGWIISTTALTLIGSPSNQKRLAVVRAMGLSALIVVPWLLHGFVTSGYLVYPNTLVSIPVDWKVPVVSANWDASWIRSWARIPHATLSQTQGFNWIGPWFRSVSRDREGFLVPLCISVIGVSVYLVGIAKSRRRTASPWIWFLLPSIAGLIFWFFEAPALRFGEASIWVTAATLGTLGQSVIISLQSPRLRRGTVVTLVAVSLWGAYPRNLWRVRFRPVLSTRGIVDLPTAPVIARQTDSGLLVNVPLRGVQCWDAPLPCTPYFNSSLRLRRPGNIASGFISTRLADELEPLSVSDPRYSATPGPLIEALRQKSDE